MYKTLGGDRLGSGKKQKVELRNYERSTHNKGYLWRSTMSAGTLVPFIKELALPGDTWDINLNCVVLTHPTLGPLFGSYKVQLDVFQAPLRLYQAVLHNNQLGIGLNMSSVLLPQIERIAYVTPTGTTDIDNSQTNPSCILSYIGIRGIGTTDLTTGVPRTFNAIPYLAYWDIYKNYYANKQEGIGVVIHTPSIAIITTVTSIEINSNTLAQAPAQSNLIFDPVSTLVIAYTGTTPIPNQIIFATKEFGDLTGEQITTGFIDTGTQLVAETGSTYGTLTVLSWRYRTAADVTEVAPQLLTFPLSNIDDMRTAILTQTMSVALRINSATPDPYGLPLDGQDTQTQLKSAMYSQEGLAIKTYQSDLLNNWLKDEWIANINTISAIDTTSGSITVDTIILARKVYDMLNQIAVSGGSYDDWLDAVYNETRYTRCTTPMYMGGLSKELIFQEVISNAASNTNGNQPLGTLAGRGNMGQKHKGGQITIKVDEPSYIIALASLTPRIDYSQGNEWDTHLTTMDDLHKPALDEIGFQDLLEEQMHWAATNWNDGTSQWITPAVGKQPAWINYMTSINKVYGNFAIETNEMFMVLNRRYTMLDGVISDATTYIDPSKFNFIFAQTSLDAQNFWVQISVDMQARRKMSAKVMPHL